ncbi:MAG: heavy metal translocating P-type ATPase [Pseudomonadota bacterium]
MSMPDTPSAAACPGCVALPSGNTAIAKALAEGPTRKVHLSLPSIHCAACISGVENGLMQLDIVHAARVNLTRKRAEVTIDRDAEVDPLLDQLIAHGFEAYALDGATLHASDADRAARELLMRLGVAGFAMMNVMLLSVAVWSGASDATRDLFHWISAAIAIPTIAFSSQPFFKSALMALKAARLNMDVPISLAILLAAGMSIYETSVSGHHAYFDAALSLTFFLLAGRYLDQKTRSTARSAAAELAAMEVPYALRLDADGHTRVPIGEVTVGDTLLVRAGTNIPVDGTVLKGASELDRALLTGETDPVAITKGGSVTAGEVNLTGPLEIRADAVGEDTVLHSLASLVAIAEASKSRYNSLADRAAKIYAPVVHLLSLAAFIAWMYISGGDVRLALGIATATLIITCPCALGLAVPAVSTVASGRLFRKGLLIKHETALERLAEVDTVVFDKTGTLTEGRPLLDTPDALPATAFSVAMALAEGSAHPLAAAIAQAGRAQGIVPAELTDIVEKPGYGIQALWGGKAVRLGRATWVGATPVPATASYLEIDGAITPFTFSDRLRTGAAKLLQALRDDGYQVQLLSGDTRPAVEAIAKELGIATWQADMLPLEKANRVNALRDEGRRVLMVGDGLNDTAALAGAHVSLAPASALDAARVAADMVLVSADLSHTLDAIRIGRSAKRRILENFGMAATYNMISIPIAVMGFASPLAAALAMSTSSILVSLNALRAR